MPSPIAHSSLAFLAWPLVKRTLDPTLSPTRCTILASLLLLWLNLPDLDIIVGPLAGRPLMYYHNGFSHSFLVALGMALPFAFICCKIAGGNAARHFLIGFLAYSSHVLLDALTWGPGVQALWPITEIRFSSPVPLFLGVRHSVNAPYYWHLLTAANDAVFGVGVFLVIYFARKRSKPPI